MCIYIHIIYIHIIYLYIYTYYIHMIYIYKYIYENIHILYIYTYVYMNYLSTAFHFVLGLQDSICQSVDSGITSSRITKGMTCKVLKWKMFPSFEAS